MGCENVLAEFQQWDTAGKGVIRRKHLEDVFGALLPSSGSNLSGEQLRPLLDRFTDASGDTVEYERLIRFLYGAEERERGEPVSVSPSAADEIAPRDWQDVAFGDSPASRGQGADWSSSSTPRRVPTPRLHFRRLLAELKQVHLMMRSDDPCGLVRCQPLEDNLLHWEADMAFPADSPLQRTLQELAERLFDVSRRHVTLRIRFPVDYPSSPPEVWIQRPRLKYRSAPVTHGGQVCSNLLSSQGWSPDCTACVVFDELRAALLEADAEVDLELSVKRGYPPAPPQLQRLRTPLFPLANGFFRERVSAISTALASAFLGDLGRLEESDKVGLPTDCGEEIFGQGDDLQTPLMFEVKTRLGRKTHCALFEFIEGLPRDFVLLPKWIMEDLFIQERETVSIRGVDLARISFVKIQPHSVDFYQAVRHAGGEVAQLLTRSLSRFSALTEDTSVPIHISGARYQVRIVHLEPQAAVRIIDTNVQRDFEFRVDFDPAPDLEDEVEMRARQNELVQRYTLRREQHEAELRCLEERRAAARRRRFEALRARVEASADADACGDGDVELLLRLPGGEQVHARLREGAPAVALYARALRSRWAEESCPWGLQLLCSYPRQVLGEDALVTSAMHRSAVAVREEPPPADDEVLFREAGEPAAREEEEAEEGKAASCSPVEASDERVEESEASADEEDGEDDGEDEEAEEDEEKEDDGDEEEDDEEVSRDEDYEVLFDGQGEAAAQLLPELDREALERRTRLEFQVQRYVQVGVDAAEARRRCEAGEVLEAGAEAEALRALRRRRRPGQQQEEEEEDEEEEANEAWTVEEPEELQLPRRPPEEEDRLLEEVMAFTGRERAEARMLLEAADWNSERAVNMALDQFG